MLKNLIYIVLFLCTLQFFSQEKQYTKVTYKNDLSFDVAITKKSVLLFDNKVSYYIEGNGSEVQENLDKVRVYEPSEREVFFTSLITDTILTKNSLKGKRVVAFEKRTHIPWEIKQSQDSILGYPCNKATAIFRGRQYTVWFTPKIPVRFGPWKINGLPGLILKVQDSLQQVVFVAEKLEYVSKEKYSFDFLKGKKITLKEYVQLLNEDLNEKTLKIIAKMPRGAAKNIKFKEFRGIELKYEWED